MRDDLISRQAATAEIEKAMCEDGFRSETGLIHKTTVYEIIRRLKAVQPERKPGHWKLLDNDPDQNAYECSACGNAFVLIDGTPKENNYNYCPNCGARMAKREKTENWEMIDNTHTEMLTWEPEVV